MNKKLIMGLAIGLCVIMVGILIAAIIVNTNKNDQNIEEDPTTQVTDQIDDSQTSNPSTDTSSDPNTQDPTTSEEPSEETTQPTEPEEPEMIPQYEAYFPALTKEQLEIIGENDVLHDRFWLTLVNRISYAYNSRHSSGIISSVEIYYLNDARLAYLIFTTESDKQYIVYNETHISEITGVYISYNISLDTITLDRWAERGFKLIHTIDKDNHPEILDFFNDPMAEVLEDNEYKDLYNLTINDL